MAEEQKSKRPKYETCQNPTFLCRAGHAAGKSQALLQRYVIYKLTVVTELMETSLRVKKTTVVFFGTLIFLALCTF